VSPRRRNGTVLWAIASAAIRGQDRLSGTPNDRPRWLVGILGRMSVTRPIPAETSARPRTLRGLVRRSL
jgi:hypothetical protein